MSLSPLGERAALGIDADIRSAQNYAERALRGIDALCNADNALTVSDVEVVQNTRAVIQHAVALLRRVRPLIAIYPQKESRR